MTSTPLEVKLTSQLAAELDAETSQQETVFGFTMEEAARAAAATLRRELAAPAQQPFAYHDDETGEFVAASIDRPAGWTPLYTAPPAPTAPQSQWVPSSKRLPPLDIPVWLSDEGRGVFIGMRSSSTDGWLWAECDAYRFFGGQWEFIEAHFDDFEPSCWMPLPAAPGDTAAPEQAEQDAVTVPRELIGRVLEVLEPDGRQYSTARAWGHAAGKAADELRALLEGGGA
ncbi:DUF551 domain-containing protein [Azotobacter vinelandii]|uniref:DUF551 domain-containing protein n=1 Tax=Azotobacter vinelandii TaxID=354 RepID=UPI0026658DFE|nr:DUF551 domain-containing protein [Azotobacter vinelandii]WKN20865.1 DUF551 domain-containing protein [Azotobacter vinelandii]